MLQIINMVPTATSPLRISPREQLTGRKLNAARDVHGLRPVLPVLAHSMQQHGPAHPQP
jgi:hypothetical protein